MIDSGLGGVHSLKAWVPDHVRIPVSTSRWHKFSSSLELIPLSLVLLGQSLNFLDLLSLESSEILHLFLS